VSPIFLALNREGDGDVASGVLTITNLAPPGTVLNYDLAGELVVGPVGRLPFYTERTVGQLAGGQSRQIQISTRGLNRLPAGQYLGTLQVRDRNGATAPRQLSVFVTDGSSGGGTNTGGGSTGGSGSGNTLSTSTRAIYRGEIGFSYSAYGSLSQGTADGTLTITMNRNNTSSPWKLLAGSGVTATLRQHSTVIVTNAVGGTTTVDMTGTYSYSAGNAVPEAGLRSLQDGAAFSFKMTREPGSGSGSAFNLLITGRFSSGQFIGSVVNPRQEGVNGEFIFTNPAQTWFDLSAGVSAAVARRERGVQLNRI
jgi:hypothetical protein